MNILLDSMTKSRMYFKIFLAKKKLNRITTYVDTSNNFYFCTNPKSILPLRPLTKCLMQMY